MSIEWNPHVINRDYFVKNNKAVDEYCESAFILKDGQKRSLHNKAFTFLEKYNKATATLTAFPQNTFSDGCPIAYRLEPQLSETTDFNKDVLTPPKFGGIPDMTWSGFCVDLKKMGKKTQTLDEAIKVDSQCNTVWAKMDHSCT